MIVSMIGVRRMYSILVVVVGSLVWCRLKYVVVLVSVSLSRF